MIRMAGRLIIRPETFKEEAVIHHIKKGTFYCKDVLFDDSSNMPGKDEMFSDDRFGTQTDFNSKEMVLYFIVSYFVYLYSTTISAVALIPARIGKFS